MVICPFDVIVVISGLSVLIALCKNSLRDGLNPPVNLQVYLTPCPKFSRLKTYRGNGLYRWGK